MQSVHRNPSPNNYNQYRCCVQKPTSGPADLTRIRNVFPMSGTFRRDDDGDDDMLTRGHAFESWTMDGLTASFPPSLYIIYNKYNIYYIYYMRILLDVGFSRAVRAVCIAPATSFPSFLVRLLYKQESKQTIN